MKEYLDVIERVVKCSVWFGVCQVWLAENDTGCESPWDSRTLLGGFWVLSTRL